MKDLFTETGMKNICDREPRIVERCLVCMERNAPRVLDDDSLRSQARVVVPALIQKLIRTIRQIAPGNRWHSVDDLPEIAFRLLNLGKGRSESLLRLLAFNRD